jgi:AraC-like DNA-binding protein
MRFQHAHPENDGELTRVFGCPITFSAASLEMRFSLSVLALPNAHPDSKLLAILMRYAETLLPTRLDEGPAGRATAIIARQWAKGLPTLATIAAEMNLPVRTLQRRLAEARVSHSALVDDVRRGLAMTFVADPTLGFCEIAYILYFADATALIRAFRRWTGETPGQFRKRVSWGHSNTGDDGDGFNAVPRGRHGVPSHHFERSPLGHQPSDVATKK